MDTDRSPSRPGTITREPTERMLGWLRLGAFVFGIVQTTIFPWSHESVPGAGFAQGASYGLSVVIGLVAVATFLALRTGWPSPKQLARVTFALDTAVVVAFVAVYSFEQFGSTQLLLLVIPLEGALKFGFAGAAISAAAVTSGEVLRQVLRSGLWGLDALWNHTTFLIGLAAIIGTITGLLSRNAERRRLEAEHEARRARELAEMADASRRDLDALHQVILAGIAEQPDRSLVRMVETVRRELGYPYVAIVLLDEHGETFQAVMRGGDVDHTDRVRPDPGGPVERTLDSGRPLLVTGEELATLASALADPAAEIVAPIRVRGEVLGVLVAEHAEHGAITEADIPLFQRLADQMGLVIESARAFQRELELAERYQELDRLKTDFIAITSHELRTPLTAILGFAETLTSDDRSLTPTQVERIHAGVLRQARRLRRLVEDLRTVSRLDAGTLEIWARPTAVRDAVDAAVEATGTGRMVEVTGPRGAQVEADPDRLTQVLTNLIANAAEHGGGSIQVGWERADGQIRIHVTDDGPGVSPEERDRIFDRFVKGGNPMEHQRGSGLGLAIARELTAAMGGDLRLDPDLTTGTRFVAELPAVPTDGASTA